MGYAVKEIYYTLQGEGAQAGRAAVFCRFTGCNLWSGRERDRLSATCQFCDTDFVGVDGPGGGKFETAELLADAIYEAWPTALSTPLPIPLSKEVSILRGTPLVVCTGGEPLLQLDHALIQALHDRGFEVAIETNGTQPAPPGIDHICVSPKAGAELILTQGDELKLVFPQEGAEPERFSHLDFTRFYLQPMDGPKTRENTQAAIEYCLEHPQWRLSVQTHKVVGIP